MSHDTSDSPQLLDFYSANDAAASTILLLHGSGTSGLDWDVIVPHLSSYHLLMPSLFTTHSIALARKLSGAGAIASKTPPSDWQPAYIQLLATLTKTRAKNGRAHIVGLSMGASLAVGFVTAHPELIRSVFATGIPVVKERPSSGLTYSLKHAGLLGAFKLQDMVGPAIAQRLMDGEVKLHSGGWDGKGQHVTSETMSISMDICIGGQPSPIQCTSFDDEGVTKPVRIYIVAATRTKWWMPTGDSVDWAVEVAKRLGGVDDGDNVPQHRGESVSGTPTLLLKALEAKRMFHPWSRQAPEVFAQCVLAAVEGTPLPASDITVLWSHPTARENMPQSNAT